MQAGKQRKGVELWILKRKVNKGAVKMKEKRQRIIYGEKMSDKKKVIMKRIEK